MEMRPAARVRHVRVRESAQRRQGGSAGHGYDARDEGGDPARLHREHPGRQLDPVTEDQDAQPDPHQRLPRRDGGQRELQRSRVERALHQPDPGRARPHQRVRRPVREQGSGAVMLQELQGLPGQRVLDAVDEARADAGEHGSRPVPATAPGLDREERGAGDDRGRRPVRERADRQPDRRGRPGQRQQRHPRAQDDRARHLPETDGRADQGDGQQQGEDQVRGEQRLHEGQRQVADGPGRQDLPADHAAHSREPAGRPHQVEHQPQAQETRLRLTGRRVLLEDEPCPDEQGRQQRQSVVEAGADVHGPPKPAAWRTGGTLPVGDDCIAAW
jgi:hypothetical protein